MTNRSYSVFGAKPSASTFMIWLTFASLIVTSAVAFGRQLLIAPEVGTIENSNFCFFAASAFDASTRNGKRTAVRRHRTPGPRGRRPIIVITYSLLAAVT